MSDAVFRELVEKLETDSGFASQVRSSPSVLDGYDLAPDERAKILSLRSEAAPAATPSKRRTSLLPGRRSKSVAIAGAGLVAAAGLGGGYYATHHVPRAVRSIYANIDFGSQAVGSASPAKAITYTNNGDSQVGVSVLNISDGINFPRDNPTATTCTGPHDLPAHGTCTQEFVFSPHSMGPLSATITVGFNSGDSIITTLSGNGTAQLTYAPTSIDFGSQAVNSTSPAKTITYSNHGDTTVNASVVNLSDAINFLVVNPSASCNDNALAAHGSCTVQVVFSPHKKGPLSATFSQRFTVGDSFITTLNGSGTAQVTLAPSLDHYLFG